MNIEESSASGKQKDGYDKVGFDVDNPPPGIVHQSDVALHHRYNDYLSVAGPVPFFSIIIGLFLFLFCTYTFMLSLDHINVCIWFLKN